MRCATRLAAPGPHLDRKLSGLPMNAEIIAIGDEITSGQNLDTNSQWLSQRLEELGVRVLYHSTVGDELAPGVEVFRHAIARADVVVATGGLGPDGRRSDARGVGRSHGPPAATRRRRAGAHPPHVRQPESPDAGVERASGDVSRGQPRGAKSARHRAGHRFGGCPRRTIAVPRDLSAGRAGRNGRNVARFGRRDDRGVHRRQPPRDSPPADPLFRRRRESDRGDAARPDPPRPPADRRHHGQQGHDHACASPPTARRKKNVLRPSRRSRPRSASVSARWFSARGTTSCSTSSCGCCASAAKRSPRPNAARRASWPRGSAGSMTPADVFRGGLVLAESTESADAMATRCREQFAADYGLAILPSPASERGRG